MSITQFLIDRVGPEEYKRQQEFINKYGVSIRWLEIFEIEKEVFKPKK